MDVLHPGLRCVPPDFHLLLRPSLTVRSTVHHSDENRDFTGVLGEDQDIREFFKKTITILSGPRHFTKEVDSLLSSVTPLRLSH